MEFFRTISFGIVMLETFVLSADTTDKLQCYECTATVGEEYCWDRNLTKNPNPEKDDHTDYDSCYGGAYLCVVASAKDGNGNTLVVSRGCSTYEVNDCVNVKNVTGHTWTLCSRTCSGNFCNTGDNHGFTVKAASILVLLLTALASTYVL